MLQNLQKYQHIFFAMLMVFVLAPWFTPEPTSSAFLQVDFWFVWFIAMLLLALPLSFLEVALAQRSKKTPLLGFEELTRQADVKTHWRAVSWFGIFFVGLLVGGLLEMGVHHQLSQSTALTDNPTTNNYLWLGILAAATVALSFFAGHLLLIASLLALVAVVLSGVNISSHWQLTGIAAVEWQRAVLLAITATGLGTGLYWQLSLHKTLQQKQSTWVVLPIWFAQLFAGVVFALFQGITSDLAGFLYAAASLLAAAVLFALVKENLKTHAKSVLAGIALPVVLLVVCTALWHVLQNLNVNMPSVVAILSLITTTIYAIFSGWHMKISHLRKSLKFDNETTYNLWRVAIRIIVPLAVISALLLFFV